MLQVSRQQTASRDGTAPEKPADSGYDRVVAGLSLVLGVIGAAYILLHSPRGAEMLGRPLPVPTERSANNTTNNTTAGPMNGMTMMSPGFRPQEYTPVKKSLFVANLTSRVGDYIVSVRRVHSPGYPFDTNATFGGVQNACPMRISMQVVSKRTGKIEQVDSIREGFAVIDNLGRRITPVDTPQEFTFPDGRGYLFALPAPSKNTAYLRSVEGVIRLAGPKNSPGSPHDGKAGRREIPFHIANVPVPWRVHVFGIAGAALLDAGTLGAEEKRTVGEKASLLDQDTMRALNLPSTGKGTRLWEQKDSSDKVSGQQRPNQQMLPWAAPVQVKGGALEAVLARMPDRVFQSPDLPGQPNYLALAQDIPNSFRLGLVPLQDATRTTVPVLECTLTPRVVADGEIMTHVRFGGEGITPFKSDMSLWSNEPTLLVLPAGRLVPGLSASSVVIVYLHLYLDTIVPEALRHQPPSRDFLAKKGERGGALAGSVTTNLGALGAGEVRLTLARIGANGNIIGSVEKIRRAMDKQGNFVLSNLAVGTYRVSMMEAKPFVSPAAERSPFNVWLAHRFGIRQPIIDNLSQDVVVQPGGRSELQPWVYHETQ